VCGDVNLSFLDDESMSLPAKDASGGNASDEDEHISIMASKSIHSEDHNAEAESFLATEAAFGCAEGEDDCIVSALMSRDNSPAFSEGSAQGASISPSDQPQAPVASTILPVTVDIGGADDPLAAAPTVPSTASPPPKLTGMAALHAGHRASIFDR
jgi:hypothetical protein